MTLGASSESPFPTGLVDRHRRARASAPAARSTRDAELRPVVDLDALNIVKVLQYPPAPIP